MQRSRILGISAFALIAVLALAGCKRVSLPQQLPSTNQPAVVNTNQNDEAMVVEKQDETTIEKGVVKEFTFDSFEFGYDVKTMTVKKGDTVKITLTNSGKYTHDWVVDEFAARTKIIKTGETDSITFVADQVGSFEYYCSVMQHRKQGMVGRLIVE